MQQQLGTYQKSSWLDSNAMKNEMERLARDGWFVHTMTAVELGHGVGLKAVCDMLFVIYRKEE